MKKFKIKLQKPYDKLRQILELLNSVSYDKKYHITIELQMKDDDIPKTQIIFIKLIVLIINLSRYK